MPWSTGQPALVTDTGVAVSVTSTATVCLQSSAGTARLRMFGADATAIANAMGQTLGDVQGPPPAWEPVGPSDGMPVSFLDSASVATATATGADYAFDVIRRSTSGTYPLTSTVIPIRKPGLTIDGLPVIPLYKDVHVLRLRDGLGWLMLMVRAHNPLEDFGGKPMPSNSSTAIVAYWAPDGDAGFESNDVRGPVFLVSRVHVLDGFVCVLWLGVPAAVEVDEGAEAMIYVYYTAEETTFDDSSYAAYPSTFVPGTRLRTMSRGDLLGAFGIAAPAATATSEPTTVESQFDSADSADIVTAVSRTSTAAATYASVLSIQGPSAASAAVARLWLSWAEDQQVDLGWSPTSEASEGRLAATKSYLLWEPLLSTNESLWTATGAWLVPGTDRGKVRIWVADGTEFAVGDAPLDLNPQGNTLLWERYTTIKDVDAVPTWAGGQLVLFISANYNELGLGPPETPGWGIWRCAAISDAVCADFGIDFVVHPFASGVDAEGARDLVAASDADHMRLDPDPVELPDGTWVEFNYGYDTTGQGMLERHESDAATVAAPWEDAWR